MFSQSNSPLSIYKYFQPDLTAICIFFDKVANLYDFVRPHLYEFIQFVKNRTYFMRSTPNSTPKFNRHRNRTSEVVRISHLVKYVRIRHEMLVFLDKSSELFLNIIAVLLLLFILILA